MEFKNEYVSLHNVKEIMIRGKLARLPMDRVLFIYKVFNELVEDLNDINDLIPQTVS